MTELRLNNVPDDHLVVGYVAHLKMLDEKGQLYFALRTHGLNDMEALGLTCDMADSIRGDLQAGKKDVG